MLMMMMRMMNQGTFVRPSVLQTLKTVRTATKCQLEGETTFCLKISIIKALSPSGALIVKVVYY